MKFKSFKSPFEEGAYAWPNLFEEAEEMLQASMLIYPLAKLRQLAKDNVIRPPEKILDLPITAIHAVELVEENATEIAKEMGDESTEMLKSAMTMMHLRYQAMKVEENKSKGLFSFLAQSPAPSVPPSAMLVAFGDNNATNELVYGVAIDSGRKRITVAFRGSTTNQDFLTDASVSMKTEENIFAYAPNQEKQIKIHSGFYDYLLSPDYNCGLNSKGNKFDEIIGIISPLLKLHPDYRLYVTGHSLGGALATLFSFKAAACHPTPFQMPITCVSIASPKVGDDGFRKAFQLLEEAGKLRHLRVANSLDPVTQNPPASTMTTLAAFSPAALLYSLARKDGTHNEIYYHVGVKLKLFGEEDAPPSPFKISYSRGDWKQDMFSISAARYVTHHYCKEYYVRLTKLKAQLEKMYLNDVYAIKDKSGVGRSLHERFMEKCSLNTSS